MADLVQAAPGVQVIVTSRERLNLRGEQLYHVPPLDFAPAASDEAALASASVQLFVQSAQRGQPGFALNPANAAAVLRICQLAQGMPLALELAAAYVGTLPLPTIAAEIERSADEPGTDEAEQTLSERQRVAGKLRAIEACMLVTQGNFDRATVVAQQAITLSAPNPPAMQPGDGEALGYLAWGQALYHQSHFSHAQLQCEQALRHAREAQQGDAPNELLFEVEVTAQLFLGAAARTLGDYSLSKRHFTDCLHLCQRLGKLRGEIHAHMNLGYTTLLMRDLAAARQEYEQALALIDPVGYRWGEGVSRYELGMVVRLQGEYSLALDLWQQALAIFGQISERLRSIYVLGDLVKLYSRMGDFDRAQDWQRRLLSVRQAFNSPDSERAGLLASALLAHCQGDDEQALDDASQAWQIVQQTSSRSYQADVLMIMGHAQAGMNLVDAAIDSYTQALTLYQTLGSIPPAAEAQANLARVAFEQGDLVRAQRLTDAVLAVLAGQPVAGLDKPFRIYLTCFRVLEAGQDPRAPTILRRGYELLQNYASSITDDTLRRTFLENVPVNWALQQAYTRASVPGR